MRKRFLTVLLSIVLLLTGVASAETNLLYEVQENGRGICITGWEGDPPIDLTIPERIDGLLVKEIGYHAFESCTSLRSVTLPHTVTCIDMAAFLYCANLAEVNIPPESKLQSLDLPVFLGCAFDSIWMPDSCRLIGPDAFGDDVEVSYMSSRRERVTQRWGDVTDPIMEHLGGGD